MLTRFDSFRFVAAGKAFFGGKCADNWNNFSGAHEKRNGGGKI